MGESLVVLIILAVIIIVLLIKTAIIVPQRSEFIIERLGKYSKSLGAGFHILVPLNFHNKHLSYPFFQKLQ